jgi:hypothetical protein
MSQSAKEKIDPKRVAVITVLCALILVIILIRLALPSQANSATDTESGVPGTGSSLSRVHLYSTLEELTDESVLVILGTVANQETAYDINDSIAFTLATVEVSSIEKGDLEGTAEIIVRQTGALERGESILQSGETYLFYLVASGLEGDLANQYYITGATAGVYRVDQNPQDGDDGSYGLLERVDKDSEDLLPDEATLTQVRSIIQEQKEA